MTRIISPEEFNATFLSVAKRRRVEIERLWSDSPKYTRCFLGDSDDCDGSLLADVAKNLDLKYHPGWWQIDGVMYEKCDELYLSEDWPEQLTVVIEHENAVGGSRWGVHKEINKLSTYNSPLKVLFTYPYLKPRHDRLKGYADILRRADTFNDFTTHRRHLVIYGLGPDQGEPVYWESYVYRLGEFVPLGGTP